MEILFYSERRAPTGRQCVTFFDAAGARFDTTDFSAAEVEREVITPSGKFIDLLVTTRSLIVAVENKIDAPLYNDLADYSGYVDQRAHGRRSVKVVLCLSEGGSCFPFTPVTYKKFFARLRNNLEKVEAKSTINNRYLDYLNDIMTTIDDLNQRKQTDRAFRRFVTKHEKVTTELVSRVSDMKEEFHEKIRELERLIRVKPARKGIYKSRTVETQIYESLWLKYRTKGKALVEVEAWISAVGWQVEAYREKDAVHGTKKRFDYDIPVPKVADYALKLIGSIKTKL